MVPSPLLGCVVTLTCLLLKYSVALAFAPRLNQHVTLMPFQQLPINQRKVPTTVSTARYMSKIEFSSPSQDEAVALGIREWPQQVKPQGSFVESVDNGKTVVRYILKGRATVSVSTNDGESSSYSMQEGNLLEVAGGAAELEWEVSSNELIVLTPTYEQGGLLVGVAAAMVILLGTLVATSA